MSVQLPNSIFLHVPKNSGNWVMKVLRDQGLYKQDIRSWNRFDSFERNWGSMHAVPHKDMTRLPCFMFVRHPLTWFKSYWTYKGKRGMFDIKNMLSKVKGEPRFINLFDLTTGMQGGKEDFKTWIRNVHKQWPEYYARYIDFFAAWCEPENIGRVESLEEDYAKIIGRLEPEADMASVEKWRGKLINASGSDNTATEYDAETERLAKEMGQPVIERWY